MAGITWWGLAEFKDAIDPEKFKKTLSKYMRRASGRNGKLAEAAVRRGIRKKGFAPNKPLTAAIKGSTKPLVDNGESLFQAITSQVINDNTVFVGILQTAGVHNIAKLLHDGGQIKVTDKMRGLFFVLWQASIGAISPSELTGRAAELWERMPGGWKPLKESTTVITIPPRPFITRALADTKLKERVRDNWREAVRSAIKERAKQVSKGKDRRSKR